MNFKFKRIFGQNFIVNENIIKNFLTKINLENKNVIEIGPGKGVLTKQLCEKANRVKVFEIDLDLKEFLDDIKANHKNLEIFYGDFFDNLKYIDKSDNTLISNPPYNITSKILFYFLDNDNLKEAILTLQKEVVDRLLAIPDSKQYNSLTLIIDFFCEKKLLLNLKKTCFFPVPKVDSATIRLVKRDNLNFNFDKNNFINFLKKSFFMKRKTLFNNITHYFKMTDESKIKLNNIITEMFADNKIRSEKISIDNFKKLYERLLSEKIL